MLHVGDTVPDFTLPVARADGRRENVQFSSLLGKGPIVLSFFPLAFTRVCTSQMCDARDNQSVYDALDAQVFGFSCDSMFTNEQYAKSLNLAHGIFSDANRDVVHSIWATQEVVHVRNVPKRGWMVVDAEGRVVATHVSDIPGAAWGGTKPIEDALVKARS